MPDDVGAILCDIVGAAQRTCPTVRLPPDVFTAYLRERLPPEISPPIALRRMHTSDLYLACACSLGDPNALAAFDQRCLGQLDRVLSKLGIDSDVIAEVKQEIRYRVLVGNGGRAEIVDFAGHGDLRGWVRVMATRQALRRQGAARREVPVEDDELLQRMVEPDTPELDYMKGFYRHEFKRAFESALQALPYRVHRATAARLLARARALVLEATRDRLMSQLEVSSQDLDSILRMIWSRIEISLRALRRGRKR